MPPKAPAKPKNTDLINWDEKLAADAKIATAMVASAATGDSFSFKDGVLSFNGNPIEGNTMAVVILDAVMMNANYPDKYDPKNPSGPNCFAFGRTLEEMTPHAVCVEAETAQAPACVGCPHNEFGTNDRGTGKQCGNNYRLAVILAGEFDKDNAFEQMDATNFKGTSIAYLKVPPTSLKAYAGFTKQLEGTMKRAPHGIFTRITGVEKGFTFEALEKIGNDLMPTIMKRREEALASIEFPFPKYTGPTKARKAAPAQRAAGKSFAKAPAAKAPAAKASKAPKAGAKAPAAKAPAAGPKGFGIKSAKVSKF